MKKKINNFLKFIKKTRSHVIILTSIMLIATGSLYLQMPGFFVLKYSGKRLYTEATIEDGVQNLGINIKNHSHFPDELSSIFYGIFFLIVIVVFREYLITSGPKIFRKYYFAFSEKFSLKFLKSSLLGEDLKSESKRDYFSKFKEEFYGKNFLFYRLNILLVSGFFYGIMGTLYFKKEFFSLMGGEAIPLTFLCYRVVPEQYKVVFNFGLFTCFLIICLIYIYSIWLAFRLKNVSAIAAVHILITAPIVLRFFFFIFGEGNAAAICQSIAKTGFDSNFYSMIKVELFLNYFCSPESLLIMFFYCFILGCVLFKEFTSKEFFDKKFLNIKQKDLIESKDFQKFHKKVFFYYTIDFILGISLLLFVILVSLIFI